MTDPVDLAHVEALAWALRLDQKEGAGVLFLPSWGNELGARQAGITGGGDEVLAACEAGTVRGLVFVDVDPISDWPEAERWQMAVANAERVLATAPFTNAVTTWAHLVLPAAVDQEREGSQTNLEGRTQRLRPAVQPPGGVSPLEFLSAVGVHLGLELPSNPARVFARMVADRPSFGTLTWGGLGERAPLVRDARLEARAPKGKPPRAASANGVPEGRFRLVAPPVLMRGVAVERQPHLAHQRAPWVMLNHADAVRLGLADGDVAVVGTPDGEHRGQVRTSRRLVEGAVRINRRGAPLPGTATATVAAAGKTG